MMRRLGLSWLNIEILIADTVLYSGYDNMIVTRLR